MGGHPPICGRMEQNKRLTHLCEREFLSLIAFTLRHQLYLHLPASLGTQAGTPALQVLALQPP